MFAGGFGNVPFQQKNPKTAPKGFASSLKSWYYDPFKW